MGFVLWGHQICCCIANDKIQVIQNTCLLVFFPIRLFNSSYAKSCERSDACQGYWYHDHSHYIISMIMIRRRMPIYPFLIIHLTRGKNKLKLATINLANLISPKNLHYLKEKLIPLYQNSDLRISFMKVAWIEDPLCTMLYMYAFRQTFICYGLGNYHQHLKVECSVTWRKTINMISLIVNSSALSWFFQRRNKID